MQTADRENDGRGLALNPPVPDFAKGHRDCETNRRYFTQQAPPAQHEPDAQQAVSQAHGPPTSQAQPSSRQTQLLHSQSVQQSQQEADV